MGEFDTLTGLSPGMQNLALAGGLAIPAAGGLYYYKKRRDQQIAEASGIAGKMKAKLGKKLFYVVSLTGITAVGGWLVKRFKPEWYKAFVAKLPNLWPFTYLKGKAKKTDSDDSSTEEDKGSKSNSKSKKSAARPKSPAIGSSSGNGGGRDAPAPQTPLDREPRSSGAAGDMFGQS